MLTVWPLNYVTPWFFVCNLNTVAEPFFLAIPHLPPCTPPKLFVHASMYTRQPASSSPEHDLVLLEGLALPCPLLHDITEVPTCSVLHHDIQAAILGVWGGLGGWVGVGCYKKYPPAYLGHLLIHIP